MERDRFSEIEQAAADERAERVMDTRPPRWARIDNSWFPKTERGAARVRLRVSLTDDNNDAWSWRSSIRFVVCFWPMVVWVTAFDHKMNFILPAFLRPPPHLPVYQAMLLGMGTLALCCALYAVYSRTIEAFDVLWLHRIGHDFDVKHYLDQLSMNRKDGTLVVRFNFVRAWNDEPRKSTPAAVHHWMPEVHNITWIDDSTLEICSDSLSTTGNTLLVTNSISDGFVSWFTNRPIHVCFIKVVRHVLPKLNAAVPVQRLDVNIQSETRPWYARAGH